LRIVKRSSGYFSVKSFQKPNFPKANYFGAVTSINLSTLKTTVIATGLRHLGGLVWDQERKALWETENGPRGGDELNIILSGKNYG
jgi:glucose/arabinose dehydrogenase